MPTYEEQAEAIVPHLTGQWARFEAYGRKFCVRRLVGRSVWFLRATDGEHGRFGTLPEIRQDVAHVLLTGNLPRAKESPMTYYTLSTRDAGSDVIHRTRYEDGREAFDAENDALRDGAAWTLVEQHNPTDWREYALLVAGGIAFAALAGWMAGL